MGAARTRVGFIGAGVMARHHLEEILEGGVTDVVAICEPAPAAYAAAAQLFDQHGLPPPPNEPDWNRFVATYQGQLDAVFIITPHVLHFAQATACLEAGFDVLLEKPMVMTADEATGPDRDARPDRAAARRRVPGQPLAAGPRGVADAPLRRARADPQHQRGGLAGLGDADRGHVAPAAGTVRRRIPVRHGRPHAQHRVRPRRRGLRRRGRVARGRWPAGRHPGRGHGPAGVGGAGHDERHRQRDPVVPFGHPRVHEQGDPADRDLGRAARAAAHGVARLRKVSSVAPMRVWDQFLNVRAGTTANPSPPEVGLRMARLWDAIRESTERGGASSSCRRHRPRRRSNHPSSSRPWVDDPGHRLERIPPGALRPRRRGRLPRRHPRRGRRRLTGGRASMSGPPPSTNPSTA